MILAITGHRPNKVGGYDIPNPTYISVCQKIEKALIKIKPEKMLIGMALGVDSWTANICNKLNIPYAAIIPFVGFNSLWNDEDKKRYDSLLKKSSEIIYVSPPPYTKEKLQIRNQYLVDNSDALLAVWNLEKNSGTYNCISYAISKNKLVYYIKI